MTSPPPSYQERVLGCLLGGAVGDALGAPFEFLSEREVRARVGVEGPDRFFPAFGRTGAVTDDTQMTLFTAEGILRAAHRWEERGICAPALVVHHAYLRWLYTQGERSRHPLFDPERFDGWLVSLAELHVRRAPGATCLGALKGADVGTMERPLNDSKGCGGVMRVAPIGVVAEDPFGLGCEVAALTHGHPSGYLAAGFFALLVRRLLVGEDPGKVAREALDRLRAEEGHEETTAAVEEALLLAESGEPPAQGVRALGEGWVAEEALAVALFCALRAGDFAEAVRPAAAHGGDTDSTAALAGQLAGARFGVGSIPLSWRREVELGRVVEATAADLAHVGSGGAATDLPAGRYPPW